MTLNAQTVGNVGLYFACYHLSLLGWNVMPTARNARGVDVIAYNLRGTQFIGIQIKTLSKRNPVPLGTSLENLMGDYWIIINRAVSEPMAKTPEATPPAKMEKSKQIAHAVTAHILKGSCQSSRR